MKRPSTRTLVIGSISFFAGFTVAATLSFALAARGYDQVFIPTIQSWSLVSPLVDSNRLLHVADQQPAQLAATVVSDAQSRSLAAANNFDFLSKDHQRMVLRQLAALDRSPTLHADDSPQGRTAHLARLMVLCSHSSARPNLVDFGNESGSMMYVPKWVLDPEIQPVMPAAGSTAGNIMQSPNIIAAERKKWTALRQWVIDNRSCIAAQEQTF